MTTESLKEAARKHEQNEEWIKALDLYLQAIEEREEGEEPDIALHNRVGDLQVRLGDVEGAVASYETAIQLYIESDLLNNAIAICRKIIRNTPNRPTPFLRMGQIRARQGFLVDSRQNFITYAEMMEARGKTDEALQALEELVDLTPKDVDTRIFLAEHLYAKGRPEEALRYFTEGYRSCVEAGNHIKAEEILARLRDIAPDAPIPTLLDESPVSAVVDTDTFRPIADGDSFAPEEEDAEDLTGFETTSMSAFDAAVEPESPDEEEASPALMGGFEFSDISLSAGGDEDEGPTSAAPEGFELSVADDDDSDDDQESLSPSVEFEDPEASDLPEEEDSPLPLIDFGDGEPLDSEDVDESEPLPLLTGSSDLDAFDLRMPAEESDEELEEELSSAFNYDAEEDSLVGQDDPDAEEEVEFDEEEEEEESDASLFDTTPLDPLIALYRHVEKNPDDIDSWQRILEQAHPAGDRGLLAFAYLGLASALKSSGEEARAQDAYRQLLTIDPYNPEALSALGQTPEEEPTTESAPPSSADSEGYVDLGAMILGDSGQGTTRWVVSAAAPSGDESADFSRLLSQFKEQVARNLSVEDAEAHYDLGTAYKEMGLVDEAISEFQLALRAQPNSLATFEMLGQCFLEKGEPTAAVRTLERALKVSSQVEDDLLGIYYFMGRSQEALGKADVAKDFYERIFALDINFKDVTERLRSLR